MARLVIKSLQDGLRVFDISTDRVLVGRGDDVDLLLPNISVSRHHAQLNVDASAVTIEDLKSSNGTLVNGKRITARTSLASGDEISMGKFTLVYMGNGPEDRFYDGRYLEYMVKYEPSAPRFEDSTFAMSPDQLRKLQEDVHTMRNAKLVLAKNKGQYWHPEDRPLTFGGSGMVSVEAMFSSGVLAEIAWDGARHVITKKAFLTKVLVNDESVSTRALRPGDRVRIGSTTFIYELPSG